MPTEPVDTTTWRWELALGFVWTALGAAGVIVATSDVWLQVVAGLFFFLGGGHVAIAMERRSHVRT